MSTTDECGAKINSSMAKRFRDAHEQTKKLASEENPNPLVPNPYPKGTDDYERHEMNCLKSYENMLEKIVKNAKDHGLLSETGMEAARKRFESPEYREQYDKDFKERIAAQRAAYGDDIFNFETEQNAE